MRLTSIALLSSLLFACGGDDVPDPAVDAAPVNDGFLLAVADPFQITGRGVIAVGEVTRGTVKIGDSLDLVGLRPTIRVHVNDLAIDNVPVTEGKPGDNLQVFIDGVERNDLERGQMLATVGSIDAITDFEADITLLTHAEGGRDEPLPDNSRPDVHFFVLDMAATVDLPGASLDPGGSAHVAAKLVIPMAVEPGFTFLLREGGRTIGNGTVTAIH